MNDRLSNTPGLFDKYREDIINKTGEISQYFSQIQEAVSKKQLHEDVGFNVDEVLYKLESFKATVNSLFTQPPPKQETPKPEAQQQQQQPADAEMKDETPPPTGQ